MLKINLSKALKSSIDQNKIIKRLAFVSLFLYSLVMAYNPFYWWRRFSKSAPLKRKDALKGKSFLLQQIEHGDFEYSDYSRQAKLEPKYLEERITKLRSTHKGGEESFKEKVDEFKSMSAARINRLMADHNDEEVKLLYLLRDGLRKEFGVDVWESSLEEVGEGDLKALYYTYQKLAEEVKNGTSKCGIESEVTV